MDVLQWPAHAIPAERQVMSGSAVSRWVCPLVAGGALTVWMNVQVTAHVGAPQSAAKPSPSPSPSAAPQPLEQAVRDALQQYSTALESLDADQVKKIHPSVDTEGLKRAFREMRELKVTIDSVKVLSSDSSTARVSCRVTQALTPRAGSRQNTTVTRVMRLKKQEALWLVDGFER